jgi:hypothetical protein
MSPLHFALVLLEIHAPEWSDHLPPVGSGQGTTAACSAPSPPEGEMLSTVRSVIYRRDYKVKYWFGLIKSWSSKIDVVAQIPSKLH